MKYETLKSVHVVSFLFTIKQRVIGISINSPIHKAAGSLVTGRSLQNGKMSMGNRHTERPPDPVLYGGRPSGGFVNRAVSHHKKLQQSMFLLLSDRRSRKCFSQEMFIIVLVTGNINNVLR